MTLHLYFGRRFLKTFLSIILIFYAILVMIDLIEEIRRFGGSRAGFATYLELALLNTPKTLYDVLPLMTVLATIALFIGLARSSELVVARAAGRSGLMSLVAPVTVALLMGLLAIAVLNPIVAATSNRFDVIAGRLSQGGTSTLSVSNEGLWLRQGSSEGQTVIHAAHANFDGTELSGVSFVGFDPNGTPVYRIEADRASLVQGAWEIEGAKEWRFDPSQKIPEVNAFKAAHMSLASNLTAAEILDSFGSPSSVPIWELPGFIARLEAAGFSARTHLTFFESQLAMPLMLVAMVLVGAGFTMRHARLGGTGLMVLMALGLGFTLFFIRNLALILGESGQIPVALAAWGPPLAATLLPLGLLLHLEDG